MDLNVSPLPEEDEEETFRQESTERHRRLKRAVPDDRPKPQPADNDSVSQKRYKFYDRRSSLPQGWLDCPGAGQPIGYIIPSKVPLGESFNDVVPPGKRYSLRQVIHQQRVLGRELGMVIDLTNTDRYYPAVDWERQGIQHVKIRCRGRDEVPDSKAVNEFVYEVSQFFLRKRHMKKCILVHCTHGHNRTGFMIVHYLMRSQPTTSCVSEAIEQFAAARPPGIYKDEYLDVLYRFYHEKKPENFKCPYTPEWKKPSEFDLNGEADDDDDAGSGCIGAKLHGELKENEIMTNDDVLGDEIPNCQQNDLRRFCYQALKLPAGPKGASQFPGSHPVSLNRDNLQLLKQRYYYATWKADGTRYMMLITSDGCYLIDRNFLFRRVQMRFPLKAAPERTHEFSLLDGEMVIDKLPDTELARRYLIYDILVLNMQSVLDLPFYERWNLIETEVVDPRNAERQHILQSRNPNYQYELEPFRVRRKHFWLLSTVGRLLKTFIPALSHAADGLVFQGWDDPYVPRTHEGLLKWKYAYLNSVDFQFEVASDGSPQLSLFDRGRKRLMEGSQVLFGGMSDISSLSGKIIECSWDAEQQSWVFMRVRVDKSIPNELNTYRKVMRSIKDNITEEDLMKEIEETVRLPMYADRIRNDTKTHLQHHHHANVGHHR